MLNRQGSPTLASQTKYWKRSNTMKVLGAIILVLAVVVATVPQITNCQYEGKAISLPNGSTIPMKCLWTARGELALAIPIFAVGAMMSFSRRKETSRNLAALGVILGIFTLLLPTSLIGVCSSNMPCNTVMKPTMLVSGSAIILTGIIGLVLAQRREEK